MRLLVRVVLFLLCLCVPFEVCTLAIVVGGDADDALVVVVAKVGVLKHGGCVGGERVVGELMRHAKENGEVYNVVRPAEMHRVDGGAGYQQLSRHGGGEGGGVCYHGAAGG